MEHFLFSNCLHRFIANDVKNTLPSEAGLDKMKQSQYGYYQRKELHHDYQTVYSKF